MDNILVQKLVLPCYLCHAFTVHVSRGRVAQSVAHLTQESEVPGSISGPATYFCFSFPCFKKGSCQLLAKVCEQSTGSKLAQEKCG